MDEKPKKLPNSISLWTNVWSSSLRSLSNVLNVNLYMRKDLPNDLVWPQKRVDIHYIHRRRFKRRFEGIQGQLKGHFSLMIRKVCWTVTLNFQVMLKLRNRFSLDGHLRFDYTVFKLNYTVLKYLFGTVSDLQGKLYVMNYDS